VSNHRNTPRKKARRLEVLKVRMEGAVAFKTGIDRIANPYDPKLTMDASQWDRGWYDAWLDNYYPRPVK
jgi:hypothetical protein